ncbi:unnamed protein product [Acidithrix sp. C25]|nr:unnamed protein product [Acidithrix sp. C25]
MSMWDVTSSLPEQVSAAAARVAEISNLPDKSKVENIVVFGMGGSGIAGDVLVAAAGPVLPVPASVVKSYTTPAYISPSTLVFAMSFSGETEETQEAVGMAVEMGAQVVVVSTGGELADLAMDTNSTYISVPDSIPQPRAALGALSIPPLAVLDAIGLFPGGSYWIDQTISQLSRRRDQLIGRKSLAEEIAERLTSKLTLLHSSGSVGSAASTRWRAQINENAKAMAFSSLYPENCHNELAGWESLRPMTKSDLVVVRLRHDNEHPQVSRRYEITSEFIDPNVSDSFEVNAQGEGELAQFFDLAIIGDFVSLHLAGAYGVDPGPIAVLNELKERLKDPRL